MQKVFDAVWYDPAKCEARAVAAGWDPKSGDGFLDVYMPEEDPNGHDSREFKTLDDAVAFARSLVAEGKDFWGQARINEYERLPREARCRYCTCHGMKMVRSHTVEAEGIVETTNENDCLDED